MWIGFKTLVKLDLTGQQIRANALGYPNGIAIILRARLAKVDRPGQQHWWS